MSDDLDPKLQMSIYRLMVVLHHQGIHRIHMGGFMRILGMSNESASEHDDEQLVVNDQLVELVYQMTQPRSPDQTLH